MRLLISYGIALGLGAILAVPALGDTIYNNLTPNNQMAIATRPDTPGQSEIEAADDFFVGSQTTINSATIVGLLVPGTGGTPLISGITVEIYRIFPLDSDTTRTPNVPTRANSPSDVAFDSRNSTTGGLTFSSTVISPTFTALNSVQPGGIHASPFQTTGGNGALTGQEVQITLTFTTPFSLSADHYFFVPQLTLTNGGEFYWLSASRPITGAGTTPFPTGITDLQAWTRDANLDPDWLRVGLDIVGGTTPPAFNAAFSLEGARVPEPPSVILIAIGLFVIVGMKRFHRLAKIS